MDTHFTCTACGRCCHDLKLLLDFDEAIAWARRGHVVQILCDAAPFVIEAPAGDARARYRQARTFATTSGTVPVRITVLLVAAFAGACPHLANDMMCRIYAERPTVCRIYPAEISPFATLVPAEKGCPPEAWAHTAPVLLREGRVTDAATAAQIARAHQAAIADVAAKARLCARLGIDRAALVDEGFAIHTPDAGRLLDALLAARATPQDGSFEAPPPFRIISNRTATVARLSGDGADCRDTQGQPSDYIGFFPAG